jgi:FKBP-type peptidyl-prolyl cis-trans isomerase 2
MAVTKIAKNTVVSLAYTLTVDGVLTEDATVDAPFEYLHGFQNIIPGLEQALEGLGIAFHGFCHFSATSYEISLAIDAR